MQTAQFEITTVSLIADLATKVGQQVNAVFSKIVLQARVSQERRQLLDMPAHQLSDLGISRAEAVAEATRRGLPAGRV